MPRKSFAALTTPVLDRRKPPRLSAPPGLAPSERELFNRIVSTCDASHFRPSDLPLLARYCEACTLAENAATEMRAGGPIVDGKASPWLVVQEKAVRAMTALSMRLRLSPQSRLDPKTVARDKTPAAGPRPWDDLDD